MPLGGVANAPPDACCASLNRTIGSTMQGRETPPMLETLDHVVIAVRDLEASSATLERVLGRRPSWHGEHPSYGTANVLFRLDNTYVELLAARRSGPLADWVRARTEQRGDGIAALAFGTRDSDAAARELRSRGVSAPDPADGVGRESTSGVERRWRSFLLPEGETRGVTVLVIEHRSAPELLPIAEPAADPRAAVAACDHVVVQSSDADATRELYGTKLGIRLALDKTFEQWGARLMFFRLSGITVEIAAPLGAPAGDGTDRAWGISYRVPDVAAARARLEREGLDVSELRVGRKPGTHVCTVRGEPCGVATLLLSRDDA